MDKKCPVDNDRILDKLDRMHEDITSIKIEVAKHSVFIGQNTADLSEHILRTNLLQEDIKLHKQDHLVHTYPMTVIELGKKIGYVLTAITALCTATYGIYQIIKAFWP